MSIRTVNAISGRLSLRPPQRTSLEILDRACEVVRPSKATDPKAALEIIRSEYPSATDFECEFPSLCFALATGVGKTRLMGAFVAYLHQERGLDDFFVLAPNLTIYNKLIADFTPNTPKYVFKGLGEFATEGVEIITGDNYEDGRGVREGFLGGFRRGIHLNVFNIAKINSEVRGGKSPRIKRLREYIGQSYFEYLAGLEDLVLLMDESHRYRGSAGIKVLNELRPILGLELTATPQVEAGAKTIPFKNVVYSYPLTTAMTDGFVKEPAVATRQNFRAEDYKDRPLDLERLKLEDGVRIHEDTKAELRVYLADDEKVVNVLLYNLPMWVELIHAQMQRHRWTKAAGYDVSASRGFESLRDAPFTDVHAEEVQAKAKAATEWCRHATGHEVANGGKPWTYALIPHHGQCEPGRVGDEAQVWEPLSR